VIIDQDSTNGTTLNGSPDPIPPHVPVPLNDGDRIHIGAWTTITLHRA
jgi:pSer/pThr/pTyr-binding forkhead associated (FHA) protein